MLRQRSKMLPKLLVLAVFSGLMACGAATEPDRLRGRSIVVNSEPSSGDVRREHQHSSGQGTEQRVGNQKLEDDDCHLHLVHGCDDDEESRSSIVKVDEGLSSTDPIVAPPPPAGMPAMVEFRIRAGTGTGPWNTPETMLQLRVGQTLRFINEDSVNMRLHTNNSRPCPHGPNIQPGQSWDCVLSQTYNEQQNGLLYNHNVGTSARFYLQVVAAD